MVLFLRESVGALTVGHLTRDPIALRSRGSVRRAGDVTSHVSNRGRTSTGCMRSCLQVTSPTRYNGIQ